MEEVFTGESLDEIKIGDWIVVESLGLSPRRPQLLTVTRLTKTQIVCETEWGEYRFCRSTGRQKGGDLRVQRGEDANRALQQRKVAKAHRVATIQMQALEIALSEAAKDQDAGALVVAKAAIARAIQEIKNAREGER
jgi:hypothetical protein